MTALNWSGADVAALDFTVRVPFEVKSVESVTSGKIEFKQVDGGVAFAMPLGGSSISKQPARSS